MKKNKKQKANHNGKEVQNSKKVIDLTSYISPDMVNSDTFGSYTGTTRNTYETGEYEEPEQDADDL